MVTAHEFKKEIKWNHNTDLIYAKGKQEKRKGKTKTELHFYKCTMSTFIKSEFLLF